MRLSILSAAVASAGLPAMAFKVRLTYDIIYDQSKRPLSEVACWNPNVPGLFPDYDEWLLQGNIPFPVVAIPSITGWEHPDCITCWMVTWEAPGTTRFFLAIDGSKEGFVTSLRSMNSLTGGQARDFNRLEPLEVEATQVGMTNCGFAPTDIRRDRSDEL
ncbi:Cerato-platanin-domain-containing protein [Colletotrichum cereale]|nr:Cerato-platanin-domain-containing protein [Colletotrichum cereale]